MAKKNRFGVGKYKVREGGPLSHLQRQFQSNTSPEQHTRTSAIPMGNPAAGIKITPVGGGVTSPTPPTPGSGKVASPDVAKVMKKAIAMRSKPNPIQNEKNRQPFPSMQPPGDAVNRMRRGQNGRGAYNRSHRHGELRRRGGFR